MNIAICFKEEEICDKIKNTNMKLCFFKLQQFFHV